MKRLIASLLLACFVATAADIHQTVPTSTTTVVSTSVRIYGLNFSNTTAGSVTCTLTDLSTDCSGAGCVIWPTVSIAANTKYSANLGGEPARNGFSWSCSSTGIHAWVNYLSGV